MTYIRVVDHETELKVDLNTAHIIAFAAARDVDGNELPGTHISLVNGLTYHVSDTPRQVRGYVRQANGLGNNEPKADQQVLP